MTEIDGAEMVDVEDLAEGTAEDLTEEDTSFDFQSLLDAMQQQWASDYARKVLQNGQLIAQNQSVLRRLAEEKQKAASLEAVVEQLLQEKDLSGHAAAAVAENPDQFLNAAH